MKNPASPKTSRVTASVFSCIYQAPASWSKSARAEVYALHADWARRTMRSPGHARAHWLATCRASRALPRPHPEVALPKGLAKLTLLTPYPAGCRTSLLPKPLSHGTRPLPNDGGLLAYCRASVVSVRKLVVYLSRMWYWGQIPSCATRISHIMHEHPFIFRVDAIGDRSVSRNSSSVFDWWCFRDSIAFFLCLLGVP